MHSSICIKYVQCLKDIVVLSKVTSHPFLILLQNYMLGTNGEFWNMIHNRSILSLLVTLTMSMGKETCLQHQTCNGCKHLTSSVGYHHCNSQATDSRELCHMFLKVSIGLL